MVQDHKINRSQILSVLKELDLGAGVAEFDELLYAARVETGTFWDLFKDTVDLIPGAKGSGKSALFQLFVKHLRGMMLDQKKVLLAHGVESQGNQVFQHFTDKFEKLTDTEFQNFWYVYFVSLINECLLKDQAYQDFVSPYPKEIADFKRECAKARIPDVKAPQTLTGILEWCFNAVYRKFMPKKVSVPINDYGGQMTIEFGRDDATDVDDANETVPGSHPIFVDGIRKALDRLLDRAGITVWLMLDKLDEIFPRWSEVENSGLRGLLTAMYSFRSDRVRVKVFLRDDIFEHLTSDERGFPGLTHIAARMASSLTWNVDDILHLIVKRVFAGKLGVLYDVDRVRMEANRAYRESCFYMAFPKQVHKGSRKSSTLNWIFTHCQDGRKVIAPRDVVELLIATRDAEIQLLQSNTEGSSAFVFSPSSIVQGFAAMSRKKRNLFLEAEFPHFRDHILKFDGGPAIYSSEKISRMFGKQTTEVVDKLLKIGFLSKSMKKSGVSLSIPFLYRPAFNIRQTRA